jgi:hypothetical protein
MRAALARKRGGEMEKQTKAWFVRGLLLLIILTMSCTCMPGSNNNITDEGNEVSIASAEPDNEDTTTPRPTKTEIVLPTDTVEPTLDSVEATELAEMIESYSQPTQREWSVPAYPDSTFLLDDRDGLADWDDIVQSQTRNLAIEAPYYYEFYEMPSTTKYVDVRDYFNEVIPPLGYKTGADMQGINQIYLLTYVNDGGSIKRKIAVQYWAAENMIMIIYKNPE